MRTTVVLNAKGGSGKTTLATNLAGYFACKGKSVVLQDLDPQASSSEWLRQRTFHLNQIHGQELYKTGSQYTTRAWQFRLPTHTEHVIIDTPAAIDLQKQVSIIRNADKIVIPVSPSAIEIRATLAFIKELRSFMKLYSCAAEVAIVANKVDGHNTAFKLMQQKFQADGLSFITMLSQNEQYFIAAETGASIFEIQHSMMARDKFEWAPLVNWIDDNTQGHSSGSQPIYAVAE